MSQFFLFAAEVIDALYNYKGLENYLGLDVTKNLSSGFLTKRDSNQSPRLQRLARKLKFYL